MIFLWFGAAFAASYQAECKRIDLSKPKSIMPSVVFACVAEPTKQFLEQSARLLMSVRWFGGSSAKARFVLACTGPVPQEALKLFDHYGAEVVTIQRYHLNHGHSNKIVLLGSPVMAGHDIVVLLDCDTLLVQDPGPWLDQTVVAAKVADLPTVSLAEFQSIFRHLYCPVPRRRYYHELTGDPCLAYCNSGVVIVPEKYRDLLASQWDFWNEQVLKLPQTLRFNRVHADQISLTLALENSDVPFAPLPIEMNMPAHFETYPESWHKLDPTIIHYHWLAYVSGFVKPVPLLQCAMRIDAFNARLRAERHGDTAVTRAASRPRHIKPSKVKKTATPKLIVGSGWWCDNRPHDWTIGASITQSVGFFKLWYQQVMQCLNPYSIVVTDSASPERPDYRSFRNVHWIELDRNYGQPNDIRTGRIRTKYSGFTRAVINGAMYALCCDADFYVFVEQDCLLYGSDFLNRAVANSRDDILLGRPTERGKGLNGSIAAPMLQNALMIVRRTGIERFIDAMLGAPWTDGEVSPEETMKRRISPYGLIGIPFGRSRPIDFKEPTFYVHHVDDNELARFLKLTKSDLTPHLFAFASVPDGAQLMSHAAEENISAARSSQASTSIKVRSA
jgi:hypothetical protein